MGAVFTLDDSPVLKNTMLEKQVGLNNAFTIEDLPNLRLQTKHHSTPKLNPSFNDDITKSSEL